MRNKTLKYELTRLSGGGRIKKKDEERESNPLSDHEERGPVGWEVL